VDELELWLKLLLQARNGKSLNQMTIRKPSQLLLSDSYPFDLGGVTWQGRAWRLKIPKLSILFGYHEANNVLEYLAMVITVWLCLLGRSTGDYVLCPVRRLARAVIRCHRSNLSVSTNTPICLFNSSQITSSFTRKLLRKTCDVIGNHSIWSGAAMALFLMDHRPTKMMILARWKSEAFMDYIRPKVLEWTKLMSRDMVAFDSFTDLLEFGTMGRSSRSKLGRNSEGLSVPREQRFLF
jgi:hypothetical protein